MIPPVLSRHRIPYIGLMLLEGCRGGTVVAALGPGPQITAVQLSPDSVDVQAGSLVQFSALVTYADGSTTTPASIIFEADSGIDTGGHFVAPMTPGTYPVVARTVDGKFADTSVVSVILPPPPSGSPLFEDGFESGDLRASHNGFEWGYSTKADVTIVIAHSGTHSLRFTYAGDGASNPESPDSWSEQHFDLGRIMTEVYFRWYQYWPSGTENPTLGAKWVHRQDNPTNNKFLRLWDQESNYHLRYGFSTWAQSGGDSQIGPEYSDWRGGNGGLMGEWGLATAGNAITNVRRGQWIKVQIHLKAATSSNDNGVLEMWLGGQQVVRFTAVASYPGSVGNFMRSGYLMGWANSGFVQTSYTFIDDFSFSDKWIN